MKRYELEERPYSHGDLGMIARPRGPWVRYSDAAAAVEAAYREGFLDGHIEGCGISSWKSLEDHGWTYSDARAALAEEKPDAE